MVKADVARALAGERQGVVGTQVVGLEATRALQVDDFGRVGRVNGDFDVLIERLVVVQRYGEYQPIAFAQDAEYVFRAGR